MTAPDSGQGMGPDALAALAGHPAWPGFPPERLRQGFARLPSSDPANWEPPVPEAIGPAGECSVPETPADGIGAQATFDVSAGFPDERGTVRIRVEKLELRRTPVGISDARGVLIGNSGHQRNRYKFVMADPVVSVNSMLDGNPTAKLAFARLAEKPASQAAVRALRRAVTEGPLWTSDAFRARRPATVSVTRFPAWAPITVGRSEGVAVGGGVTQENRFTYELIKPELNMAAAILAQPRLARKLGAAIRHPRAEAAQRSFARELYQVFGRATGSAGESRDRHDPPVLNVTGGDGVTVGTRNTRDDVVQRMVEGRFEVRGWDAVGFYPELSCPLDPSSLRALGAAAVAAARPLNAAAVAALPLPVISGNTGPRLPVPPPDPRQAIRVPDVSLVPLPDGTGASAVVWGAASAIASRRKRFLDAATLWAYVRHRLRDDLLPRPVNQTPQEACDLAGLREILFLDPGPPIGLLVAVDPETGTAALTSVLTMDTSGGSDPWLAAFSVGPGPDWAAKRVSGCARVFIAHVIADKAGFAQPLARELASIGAAPWLGTLEVRPGDSVVKKLFDYDPDAASAVIVVVSATSAGEPWVHDELDPAAVRRITSSARLIPVRLDGATMPASMRHLAWMNAERTPEGIRAAALQITKSLNGPGYAAHSRAT